MLSTRVILLNVTNLSDARYAAGMGVDYIGFAINPVSNHFVTSEDVNTITNWLSGVSLIGDIGSSVASHADYKVDYILTDNQEMVNQLEEPIFSIPLTGESVVDVEAILASIGHQTSFFILRLDAKEIDTLLPVIKDFNTKYKCFISAEFDNENLNKILSTNPQGIVLYGSHEEKPGLSNYEGIADILELLDA